MIMLWLKMSFATSLPLETAIRMLFLATKLPNLLRVIMMHSKELLMSFRKEELRN